MPRAKKTWGEKMKAKPPHDVTGSTRDVAPFWRVVESSSPLAKKLSFDPAWIDLQRQLELKMNT